MPANVFAPDPPLRALITQGDPIAVGPDDRHQCLLFTKQHIEQALHGVAGPHPHAMIFNLEYAVLQLGNAIALAFSRTIERKQGTGGKHVLAAQVIAAYCEQLHPELVPDAALAVNLVTRRNNYMYQHQSVSDSEAKNFGRAVGKLYQELQAEIVGWTTTRI